ncbi:hypothetical protein O1611_g2368 [Lasiodiplodia mahajangana]|uniref:Uncharacterized protein n=1 Tax=Lasiodiplodia mahajangana TaxID=1108764 RepID=A0ACC2JUT1_9PEZI|nr:hypothetical protein O1611_g2368 [Lasiodiplodia mahajangana]
MGPSIRTEPATPTDPCAVNATPRLARLSFHTAQPTSTASKSAQSKRSTVGLSCPTRRPRLSAHHTSLVAQPELRSVTPMTRPRPSRSVRAIIESAVPSLKVEAISIVPTKQLLRTFKVKLADERTLSLNLPPPPSRLLRSEQWLLQSEAAVIEWLLEDSRKQPSKNIRQLTEKNAGKSPQGEGWPERWGDQSDQLATYLPILIKHSSTSAESGSAFSLFEPPPGSPISSLGKPLTHTERKSINFQKGRLVRRIAEVTAPSGRFGQAATVIGQPRAPENSQKEVQETRLDFDGVDSWRQTFHLLLEGILRDGEDLAVTMSYELVRTTFYKFGHLLDAVTTPRLVVCDVDEDDIVLVSRSERTLKGEEQRQTKGSESPAKAVIKPDDSPAGPSTKSQTSLEDDVTPIKITGLRDWSSCIFGDPLFATVFTHPAPEFDRGFHLLEETPEAAATRNR